VGNAELSRIRPTVGAAGTQVYLMGSGFSAGSGEYACQFGASVTAGMRLSDRLISCTAPVKRPSPEVGDVRVDVLYDGAVVTGKLSAAAVFKKKKKKKQQIGRYIFYFVVG
jgi:hypothetical protein